MQSLVPPKEAFGAKRNRAAHECSQPGWYGEIFPKTYGRIACIAACKEPFVTAVQIVVRL